MAAISTTTPKIYFNGGSLDRFSSNPERIGKIWSNLNKWIGLKNEVKLGGEIAKLGFNPKNSELPEMIALAKKITEFKERLIITPSSREESGVYFIRIPEEKVPCAVFKVGAKRARSEQCAHEILSHFGLGRHVATGLFSAVANPQFVGETTEELYNGHLKEFILKEDESVSETESDEVAEVQNLHDQLLGPSGGSLFQFNDFDDELTVPKCLVGILQPFEVDQKKPLTPDTFFSIVLAMVLINGRDIKPDALIGEKICDTAENMGELFEPVGKDLNETLIATHIPLLGHELSKQPISPDHFHQLCKTVLKINGFEIQSDTLKGMKILFPDLEAEALEMDEKGTDQGGFSIEIVKNEQHFDGISPIKNLGAGNSDTLGLYSSKQINAFGQRLTRVQDFLRKHQHQGTLPSAWELAVAIDPALDSQLRALKEVGISDEEALRTLGTKTPSDLCSQPTAARRSSSTTSLRSPGGFPNPSPIPFGLPGSLSFDSLLAPAPERRPAPQEQKE